MVCDICKGQGSVIRCAARQIGYTFGPEENADSLEEHLEPCSQCHGSGCDCKHSDAWRCAVAQGLIGQIACHCECHNYIKRRMAVQNVP